MNKLILLLAVCTQATANIQKTELVTARDVVSAQHTTGGHNCKSL